MQGIDEYGDASKGPEGDAAWSIDFESTLPNFNEILISSGNCHNWLILEKEATTESNTGNIICNE